MKKNFLQDINILLIVIILFFQLTLICDADDTNLVIEINKSVNSIECSISQLEEYCIYFGSYYNKMLSEAYLNKNACEKLFDSILRKEKRLMSIEVSIVSQSTGINKGYLIVFGHYIKPPYKMEYNLTNYYLSINGIDLWPHSLNLFENASLNNKFDILFQQEMINRYMIEVNERKFINTIIQDIYHYWMHLWKDKKDLKSNLLSRLEMIRKIGLIKDYIIYDEKELNFDISGLYTNYYFNITKDFKNIIRSKCNSEKSNNEICTHLNYIDNDKYNIDILGKRYNIINNLISSMENDTATIISITGVDLKISVQQLKRIIYVMKSNGSNYQKLTALINELGVDKAFVARELFHNYKENEYEDLLSRINSNEKGL